MGEEDNKLSYSISGDRRVLDIVKQFETAVSSCPHDSSPRQTFKTSRKGDSVFVEIVTTFKLSV